MHRSILTFVLSFWALSSLIAQTEFARVSGKKATYSIEIPDNFTYKPPIGKNIDLNYLDNQGNSINTVVMDLPPGIKDGDVSKVYMEITENEYAQGLESMGLTNVKVIKRGTIYINDIESFHYQYTTTVYYSGGIKDVRYHYVVSQFRNGKLLQVQYVCEFDKKDLHLPYINRVMRSLKS